MEIYKFHFQTESDNIEEYFTNKTKAIEFANNGAIDYLYNDDKENYLSNLIAVIDDTDADHIKISYNTIVNDEKVKYETGYIDKIIVK